MTSDKQPGLGGAVRAAQFYRRIGLILLVGGVVTIVGVLSLRVFSPLEDSGETVGLVSGGLLLLAGLVRLRSARRIHPESVVYTGLHAAPAPVQRAWLARWIPLGALGFAVASGFNGWGLWQLEHGRVESAEIYVPVGFIYRNFGFYPAVLTYPALGVLVITTLVRRKRRLGQ